MTALSVQSAHLPTQQLLTDNHRSSYFTAGNNYPKIVLGKKLSAMPDLQKLV